MSVEKTNQSWGGRFSEPVDAFVARFTASVDFDKRLYRHDIMGSIAHATMLAKVGVLSDADLGQHRGVGDGTHDVVAVETIVEGDGGEETGDDGRHGPAEAA
ncbi:hypothetical protein ACV33L_33255, partial [Pseudomonas aeruginosa]